MLHLKDISLNYKIPIRVAALVIVTASILASILVYRNISDQRDNMVANADSIAQLLADSLVDPLLHDDVWRAYKVINTPFRIPRNEAKTQEAVYVLVLDASYKVFVSTQPKRYPMMSDPAAIEPDLSSLLGKMPGESNLTESIIDTHQPNNIYLATAIQSDGVRLGTLIMVYSKKPFEERFYALTRASILITLLVLAVLLPLGVYWGKRMAAPLLQLSETMGKIAQQLPEPNQINLEESKDEIGQLARSFKTMLGELKEKEQLQQQVIASDRLAALGRLAAGIAQEINNPLCGMLNSISTFKRHGEQNPITSRTLSILERGILQVKETVAALMVEANAQTRPFDLNDVADIRTLVQANADSKQINFTREIDLVEALPISSTLVRQVIINLLLNAFHSAQPEGNVHLHLYRNSEQLIVEVTNDGPQIPHDQVTYLFEPFTTFSEKGGGLELWVTYQIVQQMGGLITVQSEPDKTQFTVQLPLERPHE